MRNNDTPAGSHDRNTNPATCHKLTMFINEAMSTLDCSPERERNVAALHAAARAGDCQFNRRCHKHTRCPVAPQTLAPPCPLFYTKGD